MYDNAPFHWCWNGNQIKAYACIHVYSRKKLSIHSACIYWNATILHWAGEEGKNSKYIRMPMATVHNKTVNMDLDFINKNGLLLDCFMVADTKLNNLISLHLFSNRIYTFYIRLHISQNHSIDLNWNSPKIGRLTCDVSNLIQWATANIY